ncbi:MAG: hypothetical protein CMM15_13260 [Rhodospirillaceae bacterium]|nr:hypothetical protein [Rhodospirillaceae bacterium]|tara:strand:+ start:6123 stop:6530 length:408 start_codon:yes stop_codon:yes gene_type:complete
MNNLISLYRGLPGNREFSGIQELPYFVFNPLRNLLFTKEDIDHSASANDITTELGLDFIGGDTGDDTSKTKSQERATAFEKEDKSEKETTLEDDATPKQKAKANTDRDKVTVAPPEFVCIERQKSGEGDCIREGG